MEMNKELLTLTRRQLLKRSLAVGSSFFVGTGFVLSSNEAWAKETKHLKAKTFATLIQMARDIYPHDDIPDEYYVNAVKGYDDEKKAAQIEEGIAELNKLSGGDYIGLGWEAERVKVLRNMEESPFFQTIRGGLVTGLYNQKAIWPIFGYEGESFSKGGYLNRGFDDIKWI